MDIQKLNRLTPDNAATPKYNPYSGKSCVQVYYANNNKVIIVGVADNNYIYWLSVSKMDDIETNRSIFDYIYRLTPTVFGSISKVLESQTHYSYEQLTSFYSATLTQAEAILPHYCKDRKACYENVSMKNLGENCPEHICTAPDAGDGYRFSKAMKNPGFISTDDIINTYLPLGFSNFKIEGRGLGSAVNLEFLLHYLTKPEYQLNVREEIYLDSMLDLF